MQQLSLFAQKEDTKTAEEIKKTTDEKTVAAKDIETSNEENAAVIAENEEQQVALLHEQKDETADEDVVAFADVEIPENNDQHEQELKEEVKPELIPSVKKRGRKSLKTLEAEADLIDVPDDETLFQKQYHNITQVSKWFNVNPSLLRYWANEFIILKPKKNKKGDRFFRPEDVKNLKLIHHLLRERKYTIEGAKSYLKANAKSVDAKVELLKTLNNLKTFILELKLQLENNK